VPKKPAAPRKRKSRAAPSAGPSGSGDAPSGSAPPPEDWRTAAPRAPQLPLGLRQKQVLDYLRAHDAPATAAQIAAATGRDLAVEGDLAAALAANPKVQAAAAEDEEAEGEGGDPPLWAYLPDANVRDKAALLQYVRRAGAPVAFSEVADAYKGVAADVAALKAEGAVLGLHSFDPGVGCEVLFPTDARLAGVQALDAEVAAVWARTELPDGDDEVAAALAAAGLAPAARKAPRKRAPVEKKRKARKAQRLRAVTNVHLLHLLEGEAPTGIDA
jgi:hypothetical protein